MVRLFDSDEVIGDRVIENLGPPTDFVPKKIAVTFTKVPDSRDMKVIVDPDDSIREILEENNEVKVRDK